MTFLSAKQISEIWGISPRRVALLASQGRIPGAKMQYGRWLIPLNSVKPTDPRKKNVGSQQENSDRYIFPFPLCAVYSDEQLQAFDQDEQDLYRLCLLFENGKLAEARALSERLLTYGNRYIRIGALYYLVGICMYLGDHASSDKYSILFHTLCSEEKNHKADIELLLKEQEAEQGNALDFIEGVSFDDISEYSNSVMPFVSICEMFSTLTRFTIYGTTPNMPAYENLCRMTEMQGYFYCSVVMHLHMSTAYSLMHEDEKAYFHFKRSLDMGIERGLYFTLSTSMLANAQLAESVLREYEPAVGERIRELSKIVISSRNAYSAYQGKPNALAKLKDEDYVLISYCLRKNSIDQMAEIFGLTRSGMNKRLAALYAKLGVESKNEMVKIFCNSVLDWSRE